MFAIKTLQQRLVIFMILPVAVFLAAIGVVGYFYIRGSLYQEWQEAAILRLERAAHYMDMRLGEPLQWIQSLANTGGDRRGTDNQNWVLKKLREQPGVSQVKLEWQKPAEGSAGTVQEGGGGGGLAPRVAKVSAPQFTYPPDHETVNLAFTLLDEAGHPLGRLGVSIKLDYLMEGVRGAGWLHTYMACLVNDNGTFLAHTNQAMESRHCLGDTENPLELTLLQEMQTKPFGTVVGRQEVTGFYRLHRAPWAIMLHAQENQIMEPILRFRFDYIMAGLLCLSVSLVLIQLGVGSMVAAILRISRKAAQVAQGEYGEPLKIRSQDEIGQLTHSFNDMVAGLKERDFISNTFGRYVDQEIAAKLMARPEASRLGGEKRQVVIMFSDIRGFTPIAETLSPEATIHLLNGYFSRMVEVLRGHHGIIVDFLGDGILAFFDPLDSPLTPVAEEAVQCALHMQQVMPEVNQAGSGRKLPPLHMGIGLHAGEVVVGNIGSESRAKYGIIGSAVNLAHRIQTQARGGEVVISQDVYRLVQPELRVSREFEVRLKGIKEPVRLYAVG
ncbi:MAG: adenylate/guanylate cyclase domain-containing protein [Desulfobaccales bacterium]